MKETPVQKVARLIHEKTPAQRIGLLYRAGLCTREEAIRAIEDMVDAEACQKALADPSPRISWEDVKSRLGLDREFDEGFDNCN